MGNFRNFAVWVIIAMLLFALFNLFQQPGQRAAAKDISYTEFLSKVDAGEVRSVTISGETISGSYNTGGGFQTYTPQDPNLVGVLRDKGVEINARPAQGEDVPVQQAGVALGVQAVFDGGDVL